MAVVKGSTDVKKKPTTTITIPGTGGVKVQTVAPKPTTKAPTAPAPKETTPKVTAPTVSAVKTAAPTTKPVSGVNGGLSSIQNQSKATGPVTAPTVSAVKALGVAAPTAVTTPSMKINQAQVTNKLVEAKNDANRAQIASAVSQAPSAKVAPDVKKKIEENLKTTQETLKQVSAEALEAGLNPQMISAQAQTEARQNAISAVVPPVSGVVGGTSAIEGQDVPATVSGVIGGLSAIEGQRVDPFYGQTVSPTEVPTSYTDAMPEVPSVEQPVPVGKDKKAPPAIDVGGGATVPGSGYVAPTGESGIVPSAPSGSAMSFFGASGGSGNPFWDQLQSMKFSYNPEEDPEYLQGSAVLENQIAQMMVGRGGLYSSVMQNALSSKLIEFQIALRKQKYEQYIQDRSFMLQMANTVWDRQDAAFNQYMTVAKYNADREDAMFSRQMQQEQLNLQRASAALAQARYKAEVESYESANQLNSLVSKVKYEQGMYSKMYDEWRKTGVASTNVAAYFGTTPGAKFNYSAQKYTVAKVNYIDSLTSQATLLARDMNELDIMQAGLAGFLEQTVAPTTEYKYTQTVGEEGTTLRTEWSEYK